MKSKYIFLTLVLSVFISFSQNKKGRVLYKFKVTSKMFDVVKVKKNKKEVNIMLQQTEESMNKHQDYFAFYLDFKGGESSFYASFLLDETDFSMKTASILAGTQNKYYQNIENKEMLLQKNAFGEDFIIKSNLDKHDWVFHNESKKINSILCYKATTTRITKNSKGEFKKNVIAWYAPSLAYNFGPIGYGGLPGLIIELQDDKFLYYAAKISLQPKKSIRIKKPTKGKLVTDKEFAKILAETSSAFKRK